MIFIYKTIEGASYSLALHDDAKLDKYVDSMITIAGNAQEPDGYLYTAPQLIFRLPANAVLLPGQRVYSGK